jgi:hypothetical protein
MAKRFSRNPCGSEGSCTFYAKRFAGTVIILITVPGAFFYKKRLGGDAKRFACFVPLQVHPKHPRPGRLFSVASNALARQRASRN